MTLNEALLRRGRGSVAGRGGRLKIGSEDWGSQSLHNLGIILHVFTWGFPVASLPPLPPLPPLPRYSPDQNFFIEVPAPPLPPLEERGVSNMSTLGREVRRAEIVRKEVGGSSGDS